MRGFREDAVLGKCTFCGFKITEGDLGWQSRSARITFGRWICGSCIIGMKDAVDVAVSNKEAMPDTKEMLEEVYNIGAGFRLNPETGKLEKKDDVKKL